MIEGSPSVLLVKDVEVARGAISVDAGLSLSVRLDEVYRDLPVHGDEALLRTFEAIRGRLEYVVTIESANPEMIVVTDIELISAFQQRAIVRVCTDLPIMLGSEMDGEDLRELGAPVPATIVDLSATGLRLHSTVPLEASYRFGFQLSTDFDDLTLVAEVLRREEVPRGFLHGCRFIGTTQREADALHRYVLGEQIAQRRRTNFD